MTPAHITSVGLILDVLGVIALFYFGPPTLNITKEGSKILPFRSDDPEETRKNRTLAAKHDRMSKLGLVLLCLGFCFQLASNWYK